MPAARPAHGITTRLTELWHLQLPRMGRNELLVRAGEQTW
jgi:hypothetical protein